MEPTLKPLRAFADSRGYSHFDIFKNISGGQVNIGNLHPGVVKAFHYHREQWDHWFCIKGDIHVVCVDPGMTDWYKTGFPCSLASSKYIKHFYIGEHTPGVLSIPPGWWHGYTNVSNEVSTLLYWVTKPYDPENPDEYRIPWNVFGDDFWKPENK